MVVNDQDEILLINSDGIVIRIKADEVSKLGRTTQGVKIMKVAEDSNIIALAKVIREEDQPEEEIAGEGDANREPEDENPQGDKDDQIKLDVE
jgi:DNA gyrase subunit A